jgi:hypothetical protein
VSEVYGGQFTTYEHITALSQRNTNDLLNILGSNDPSTIDFEPEQTADNRKESLKQAAIMMGNKGLQYALARSGAIAGVAEAQSFLQQNEDRLRGQWEMRHDRIIKKPSGEWLTWTHLQHSANDITFQYKAYINRNPVGAAVGSKIGGQVGGFLKNIPMIGQFIGPLAEKWLSIAGGAIGAGFGQPNNKLIGLYNDLRPNADWLDLDIPMGLPSPGGGGAGVTYLNSIAYQNTVREMGTYRKITEMERKMKEKGVFY